MKWIIPLLYSVAIAAANPLIFLSGRPPIASAPTFIGEAETAWDSATDPKTTASFNVETGDVLVAYAVLENGETNGEIAISSSPSLTWTQQQEYGQNNSFVSYITAFTATASSSTSITVTFDRVNGSASNYFGGNVLVFRGSSGIGATVQGNNDTGSGAPSVNITTTQANSAIVVAIGDWNAVSGTNTWRTNAGSFTEQTAFADGAHYGVHGGYHADAGAISTYAVGMTSPSTQRWGLVAVEVKGP